MKYISIYLSTTPEDRADKPPRYLINFKNFIKKYKEYEKQLKNLENYIENPEVLESESGLPVYSIAIFLDVEKEDFELLKLPFKVPNKIMISRKPYKKFINYLESEFGKNLIVYFDKKNLKFYVVDSKSIYNFSSSTDFSIEYIESGVYKTSLTGLSSPIVRTVGGQKIESKITEIERKLAKFVSQKVEEIIDKFSIDRIFISSPNEKIENLVVSYFSKRALKLFKGFLSFQENNKKLFEKLISKLQELDIEEEKLLFEEFKESLGKGLAVVGIENVIKNALMFNIKKLVINLNYSHKGYICYENEIFYHKELDFECSDIEITDDITDYLIDFVIENGGQIEIANTQNLREIINDEIGAILRFKV
jgi:hypothetical protein